MSMSSSQFARMTRGAPSYEGWEPLHLPQGLEEKKFAESIDQDQGKSGDSESTNGIMGATDTDNKCLRSGSTVHSMEPVAHRRRCSDPTGVTLSQFLTHLMDEARSAHGGNSSDSFLETICTRLPSSIFSLKEPSTISSLSRSLSAPSLMMEARSAVPPERIRGGGCSPVLVPPQQMMQSPQPQKAQKAVGIVTTMISMEGGGLIPLIRNDLGASNPSDVSSVAGLGNQERVSVKRMLLSLADCSRPVGEINLMLDDLTDRAINEGKHLMRVVSSSRITRVLADVMKTHLKVRVVVLKAFKFAIQVYRNHESIRVSREFVTQILKALQYHYEDAHLIFHGWWLLIVMADCHSDARRTIATASNSSGLGLILRTMRHHSNNAKSQLQGCRLLGVLCFRNVKNQKEIVKANGISVIVESMRHHEEIAKVQRWGCYALGQLAFAHPKNQRRIASANGIHIIIQTMRRHEHQVKVQQFGCCALGRLAYRNPQNQLAIAKAEGIDVILQGMKRHEQHVRVQEEGCYTLGQLSYEMEGIQNMNAESNGIDAMRLHEDDAVQKEAFCLLNHLDQHAIEHCDGIDTILRAMRLLEQYPSVIQAGCRLLEKLAYKNCENQRTIVDANGIDVIVQVMQQCEHHAGVQACGCAALGELGFENIENQHAIAAAAGLDGILQAMQRHAHCVRVQLSGCSALGRLAADNPNTQLTIANANGIESIVRSMQEHGQHPDIQERGCLALRRLAADNPTNRARIGQRTHAVHVILQAMIQLYHNAAVQLSGCAVLGQLAIGNRENQDLIASVNGINAILQAVQQHGQHAAVQEQACFALGQLATGNSINRVMISTNGAIIHAIIQTMRQHEQYAEVQHWGCFVLSEVCSTCSINWNHVMINVILQAMKHHEQHTEVQRVACDALRILALSSPDNRLLIKNANGIDLIVRAMRRHKQHAEIQFRGEWTLEKLGYENLTVVNPSAIRRGKSKQ